MDQARGGMYYMELRITRIRLDSGEYECLISNLPMSGFTPDDIREIYHTRWGIESSFRKLKYNIGLNAFHSRKLEYVMQEIYARMVMYNFCSEIAGQIRLSKGRNKNRKHEYAVDFSTAITACRAFLDPDSSLTPDGLEKLLEE